MRALNAPRGRVAGMLAILLVAVWALAWAPAGAQPAAPAQGMEGMTDEPAEPVAENPTLSPDQESLAQTIFNELISPCCWTTTVAVHGSGAAPRIQAEVRKMIAGGTSHQQILDRYVKQYGERILAKPRKSGFNLAAYWVPYLALVVGAGVIVTTLRRRKIAAAAVRSGGSPDAPGGNPRPAAPGPDDEYHRRIEEELRKSS